MKAGFLGPGGAGAGFCGAGGGACAPPDAAAAAVSGVPVRIWTTCLKEVVSAWTNVVGKGLDGSADACVSGGACAAGSDAWMNKQPDSAEWSTVKRAESNYMRYNYCDDGWRFPQGLPAECSRS